MCLKQYKIIEKRINIIREIKIKKEEKTVKICNKKEKEMNKLNKICLEKWLNKVEVKEITTDKIKIRWFSKIKITLIHKDEKSDK